MNSRGISPLSRGPEQSKTLNEKEEISRAQESMAIYTSEFSRFPRFPREIQDMVWQAFLDEPQILILEPHVSLRLDDDIQLGESGVFDSVDLEASEMVNWLLSFRFNYHTPSIARVCKDAKQMVLKRSMELYSGFDIDSDVAQPGMWRVACNLELDTIYLDWEKLKSNYDGDYYDTNLPIYFLERTFGDGFHNIRNLAIPASFLGDEFYTDERDRIRDFLTKFKAVQHLTFIVADYTSELPAQKRVNLVFSKELIDVKKMMKLYSMHPGGVESEVVAPHPMLERITLINAEEIQKQKDIELDFDRERYGIHPDLVIDYVVVMSKKQADILARRKTRYFDAKKALGLDDEHADLWEDVSDDDVEQGNQDPCERASADMIVDEGA
ncbi:hypothetical protein ACMFMG_009909 [Clarireedia jacksonii]